MYEFGKKWYLYYINLLIWEYSSVFLDLFSASLSYLWTWLRIFLNWLAGRRQKIKINLLFIKVSYKHFYIISFKTFFHTSYINILTIKEKILLRCTTLICSCFSPLYFYPYWYNYGLCCCNFSINLNALLKGNSHKVQLNHLKCAIQWFLVYLQSCATIATVNF